MPMKTVVPAATILELSEREIPDFIRAQAASKSFSETMRVLNRQAESTDLESRAMALQALNRLGFIEDS